MSPTTGLLTDAEVQALRDAVTEAVLATPAGMRESLADDPEAALRLVAATRVAAEETSRLLREAAAGARAAGHSWDTLGKLLGVSKQAAQQRFGTPSRPDPGETTGPRERKVLSPLTSLDEMAVLTEHGRKGWELVDYGTLFHVVEESDVQWEHYRHPWSPGARRRMEAEGWTLVKTMTFPWGYYKRSLDLPPEA
ncbi:hypothetical protein CLV92_113105 [Kineococcus xinjiangensis]|uniref:Uncharacterized protein n=1 Tax=Kineococcus xinjiangensis TaxID=512762 RepID=A0A2S6IER4_9ACTN|nr:hypothetical protein [Kineococcus xinjiangensis]PPK92676.1 hypothetical protein CLV92_113105 [Kineococcus xinjiangensis]